MSLSKMAGCSLGSGSPHPDVATWRRCVLKWYPDLHRRTYFLPPVHTNRVHYETTEVGGVEVQVTVTPQSNPPPKSPPALHESTARDDRAHQRVLRCLQFLLTDQQEVSFVISQLQFGDYLGDPCYTAAARAFPRPADLPVGHKRGDFDILILHRYYGIIVAEIKTVGENFDSLPLTETQQEEIVAKKIQVSIKQLDKAEDVLKHIVSDITPAPVIKKTLMLPSISAAQLRLVLGKYEEIRQDLCRCLGLEDSADPVDHCVCTDHLPGSSALWKHDGQAAKKLKEWWACRVSGEGPDSAMTDGVYEDLITRFCGPATTVKMYCVTQPPLHVRTEGQAVADTSRRFSRIVLHPSQVKLLNNRPPLVYITGPPGTGKTVLLVLMALESLREGFTVHVLSTWSGSLAASHMIAHQVEENSARLGHNIQVGVHVCDLFKEDATQAAKSFAAKLRSVKSCVVIDEASKGNHFTEFCDALLGQRPDIRLWAASVYHGDRPPCLKEVRLTEPLRTPPVITREVLGSDFMGEDKLVLAYADSPTPLPAEGPTPRLLYHQGEAHGPPGTRPFQCEQCGLNVAKLLKELEVGQKTAQNSTSSTPEALRYRDVFLLTYHDIMNDDVKSDAGEVTRRACGVVRGLRCGGVPVKILDTEDVGAVADVATMEGDDVVVATGSDTVRGLERKVVVYLQTETGKVTMDEDWSRLEAMSRSTALLIWVVWPNDL